MKMSSRYEVSFSGSNEGLQVGINNGSLKTGRTYHLEERTEIYDTQGGAVFSGNITANRDVNITHINTIRPMAQSLYTSLFSSSEIFSQIRNELGLLISVLNATEEHARKAHAEGSQFTELKDALNNCHDILHDLSKLKGHFDSVGPQTQVTWERMGWTEDELTSIRSKISVYINVLNVLNTQMIRSSQDNVERILKAFMNEIRSGRRESSALSVVSSGSLSADEKAEWRQLRKELQSIGITPEIFSLNRDFILTTLRALSQSEFENIIDLPTIDSIQQLSPPLPHIPSLTAGAVAAAGYTTPFRTPPNRSASRSYRSVAKPHAQQQHHLRSTITFANVRELIARRRLAQITDHANVFAGYTIVSPELVIEILLGPMGTIPPANGLEKLELAMAQQQVQPRAADGNLLPPQLLNMRAEEVARLLQMLRFSWVSHRERLDAIQKKESEGSKKGIVDQGNVAAANMLVKYTFLDQQRAKAPNVYQSPYNMPSGLSEFAKSTYGLIPSLEDSLKTSLANDFFASLSQADQGKIIKTCGSFV